LFYRLCGDEKKENFLLASEGAANDAERTNKSEQNYKNNEQYEQQRYI
jgi:hypothetical protein